MLIQGKNFVGFEQSAVGEKTFRGFNPRTASALEPAFSEASQAEVDQALKLAAEAAVTLRGLSADKRAAFLLAIREEILALGDALIERAVQESGLDTGRLTGERDRTTNQLKLFADIVKEGSWVDARIDTPLPDRKPLPRPDIRRMLRPIGPVAVFGASNFPLAFSVAGGDTASALAAGNPVVVKGHPAHPGTSELVASAIVKAVKSQGLPEGTFSLVQATLPEVSIALVRHPQTGAVAFTGSERAGRALFDAAAQRPDPIPVYAEMGSTNPLFIFPSAIQGKAPAMAEALFKSVTLGVGQFCTCPGLVFGVESADFASFVDALTGFFKQGTPGTMLNAGVAKGYETRFRSAAGVKSVTVQQSTQAAEAQRTEGQPGVIVTDAATWLANQTLHEEIFGPATVVVRCQTVAEVQACAEKLAGTLTATIHGNADELAANSAFVDLLTRKAGRVIFNGFPTGVEVGYAMHHGGPYPATTDEKFTSVGSAAILRFARPVCYQNFPETLLPNELRNANPQGILRNIDGRLTRDPL
jgi:NADP-dependent aldehyde dehydrogenase